MDAILSGAAGFSLIAIVIALAAYLRSVSAEARNKIENIIAGKESLWPITKPIEAHTKERIRILNRTRNLIRWMTHVFFVFAVFVGARLCLAVATPHLNNAGVYAADIGFVAFLTLCILFMWIAHRYNRDADDANFEEMKKWKERNP
jgi:hypothetical protein